MKAIKVILLSWAVISLSGCCACDCAGFSNILIRFFDKQTGKPINVAPKCDGVDKVVDIEILGTTAVPYRIDYCVDHISMTTNHGTVLCDKKQLKFNIRHNGNINDTVTVNYISTSEPCCDCTDICLRITGLQLENTNNFRVSMNEIEVRI